MENDNNQKPPVQESAEQSQHIVIGHKIDSSTVGICALIFGAVSIFFGTLIFAPLALVMATIVLVKKQKKQYGRAIIAIIFAIIGLMMSTTFKTFLVLTYVYLLLKFS